MMDNAGLDIPEVMLTRPKRFFVPPGFAHGTCALEPDTEVAYKVDACDAPDCRSGLFCNDADIADRSPVAAGRPFRSEGDLGLSRLASLDDPFLCEDR